MTPGRPSEALTAAIGTILGALLIVLDEIWGIAVSAKLSAALLILLSWLAYGITYLVARRQRSGDLVSEIDGSVSEA